MAMMRNNDFHLQWSSLPMDYKADVISLLYAEDEPQARKLLEQMLRRRFPGLPIHVAADGEQGIALFEQYRPTIVVTDINMPVLDGGEMIERIRAIDPCAVIIAITAFSDPHWKNKCKTLKLDCCITKPMDFNYLFKAIETSLLKSIR
ncbi:response regulator [Geomesophilobacter sediminis]|uniref:Response regulator n=1 Tax=Geomesophilobacter sediminis TaxID=2798584 RepID=A0A8J7J670_9BACT|nr:response regulator [Geomesophilobacter sediminis]MBJ6724181.1 response regulator [Geomesophilobacter sediminis]